MSTSTVGIGHSLLIPMTLRSKTPSGLASTQVKFQLRVTVLAVAVEASIAAADNSREKDFILYVRDGRWGRREKEKTAQEGGQEYIYKYERRILEVN